MGRICTMYRRRHRECQQSDCQTVCATKSTDWRKMVRVGDNRIRMRRHPPVLLPLCEGAQPEQARDCTTTSGMVYTLKVVILHLPQKYPALSAAQPCSTQLDHQNLEGAPSCTECHPFQYDELLHSTNVSQARAVAHGNVT